MLMFLGVWVGCVLAAGMIAGHKGLNVLGHCVLAFFLGPIGLIITLLDSPPPEVSGENEPLSLPQLRARFEGLKQAIHSLEERARQIEDHIRRLEGQAESEAPPEPQPAPSPTANEAKPAAPTREAFEQVFGKYWLNRIGIVLFVAGLGFFISYTFQYFNALAKIGVGYLCAAVLFVWGNTLERTDRYRKIAWGILGGAWGLVYLTTYALHYIEATKLITSPVVALVLLAVVSAAAIVYNLRYKSWVVTLLTYFLAMLTVGFGGIGYATVVYWLLVVGSIAYIARRLHWPLFLVLAMAGSYMTFAHWVHYTLMNAMLVTRRFSIPVYTFQIGFGILLLSWLVFCWALLRLSSQKGERDSHRYAVTGHLINSGFLTVLGLYEIYRVEPSLAVSWDARFWFLLAVAGGHALLAGYERWAGDRKMIVVHGGISFSVLALAVLVKFPRLSVSFFWIVETVILYLLGVYYRDGLYRVLARLLAVLVMVRLFVVDLYNPKVYLVFGGVWAHSIVTVGFAVICFYGLDILSRAAARRGYIPADETVADRLMSVVGTVFMVLLLWNEVASRWLSLAWGMLGLVLVGAGFVFRHRAHRIAGLTVLSLAGLRLIFVDMAGVNTIYKIAAFTLLGAAMVAVSLMYSRFKAEEEVGGSA